MRQIITLLCLFTLNSSVAMAEPTRVNATTEYPLDTVARQAKKTRKGLKCPDVQFVRYPGDIVKYHRPVKVYEGFAPHLRRFEEILRDTAIAFYGRAPRQIRHMGTFNCRKINGYPNLISEHGVGNGIDIAGFDFGPLPKLERDASELPSKLQRAFKVRLQRHWQAKPKTIHAKFLNTLAQRVLEEDIFRVLLGPGYPGHADHFHFDMAPYRLVSIW
jgi:hypothetical protein